MPPVIDKRTADPKENMDTLIIVTVAVLSYLYFWDFEKKG
jgi:hypothetical protein